MDTENGTTKMRIIRCLKLVKMIFILMIMLVVCYAYKNYLIYDSIKVSIGKDAVINYGTNKVNIEDYISKYDGDKIKLVSKIDTSKVGEQEVIVKVTKDNITKEVPIIVKIVDAVAPTIDLSEDKIIVNQGESYDLNSNIVNILDDVDGKLDYVSNDQVTDDNKSFYTYYSDTDINTIGVHNITVKAVDNSGNVTEKTFEYEVKKVVKPTPQESNIQLNYNLPANGSANGIVGLAYSLIGSRYVSGGTTPAGFDCSGFVQYVYAQNGIYVSRSSYTQAYDGVAVPYSEAQPGDILSWGTSMGNITHSALYVGDGMMIHATNPSQGVLLSNIEGWTRGSGTRVITVRRIN